MDEIETSFLAILKHLYTEKPSKSGLAFFLSSKLNSSRDFIDGDYLCLEKALQNWKNRTYVQLEFKKVHKEVKEKGKKYIDVKGTSFFSIISFLGFFCLVLSSSKNFFIIPIYVIFLITTVVISAKSALFIRFNEKYYLEYQRWQAFKKYLSYSFTISDGDHRAVAIWGKYLVYATALGVSKKVIKELRQANIISENQKVIYMGIYNSSGHFSASTGSSGGGGFGGAGGGGVGGGGGGGR